MICTRTCTVRVYHPARISSYGDWEWVGTVCKKRTRSGSVGWRMAEMIRAVLRLCHASICRNFFHTLRDLLFLFLGNRSFDICVPLCSPGSTITLSGRITWVLLCSEIQEETAAKDASYQYGLYLSPLALAPSLRFRALVSASSFAVISVGSGALHARTHPSSPAVYMMLD